MKESGDDYEGELLAEQVTLDWHMMESLEERRGAFGRGWGVNVDGGLRIHTK
jgi:hypothetical protein